MKMIILSMFISSVSLGTVLVTMSSNWFFAWMGLEFNTLAIIPILMNSHTRRAEEAAAKYFIMQAAATMIFLFATGLQASFEGDWGIQALESSESSMFISVALFLKLGVAPFHFWLPEVMQGLPMMTGLLMVSWQKLAPFALLLQASYSNHPHLLVIFGAMSVIMGCYGGLKNTQLRKILAYSSTAHLGWMLVTLVFSKEVCLIVLTIYITSTLAIFLSFDDTSTNNFSGLTQLWSKNPIWTTIALLVMLSMAGLPPFFGFAPKWFVIEEMAKQDKYLIIFILLTGAIPGLFFYVRLCYFAILSLFPGMSKLKLHWRYNAKKVKSFTITAATAALILLPILPLTITTAQFFFTH
nr:NADH dehydrogenase subunit 2 [Hyphessobrycon sweglesi]